MNLRKMILLRRSFRLLSLHSVLSLACSVYSFCSAIQSRSAWCAWIWVANSGIYWILTHVSFTNTHASTTLVMQKKQKNMSFLMRVLSVNVPSWKSLRSSDVVEINSCCNAKVSSLRRKWWRTNPWKQTKLATTLKWFCTPKLNLKQPYQFKLRHLHPESLLPCQSCWVEHLSLTPRRCMACDVVNVQCITESTPQLR